MKADRHSTGVPCACGSAPGCLAAGDNITLGLLSALQAVLAEVTPGVRPFSTDSWLPEHIIKQARNAVAEAMGGQHSAAETHTFETNHKQGEIE